MQKSVAKISLQESGLLQNTLLYF